MRTDWRLIVRGFVQVAPTGAATVFIASHNWIGAACASFVISFIWYGNVRASVRAPGYGPALCYGVGASLGTVAGMTLAAYLQK